MEIDLYDVWKWLKEKTCKYRVLLVFLVEIIFFAIYCWGIATRDTIDISFAESGIYADTPDGVVYTNVLKENTAETIQRLHTEGILLERGIYDISVKYKATNGGMAEVFGQTLNNQSIWYDTITLAQEKTETSFQVWVNDKTDGCGVSISSNGGELKVEQIRIKTAWNSVLYLIICALAKISFLDLVLLAIRFRDRLQKYSVIICGILGITFICSLGIFTRYLLMGHDAMFHMNRIEGLKDGLLSGAFPVRIQPTWNNGWGYAVSVMYGDLILIFPALMRICGFTVQTTWKTFLVTVNLATAIVAFYSFHKICKDKYKALFTTLLYCTGLYRLECIYIRAAVGEFGVMIFLPLVILGFWYALGEDVSEEGYGKKLIAPVIGFTGMLQTHILTCEIAALFIILLCIIMIRKVLQKKTFIYLAKIVIATVLVNLWFLVPFFDFLGENLVISKMSEMRSDFQTWGLSVAELFATSASQAYYFTFGENVSLADKCTLTVGFALWASAALTLFLLWNKKIEKPKASTILLLFGIISACMATNLFPYDFVREYLPLLAKVLSKIQFSYRFLGMTGLFFTLASLFAMMGFRNEKQSSHISALIIVIAVLAIYQGMNYQYQVLFIGKCENKYCASSLDTTDVVTGEYLYEYSYVDITNTDRQVAGNGVEILETKKKYLNTDITCSTDQRDAYIEVPTFYYPGYVAVDDSGKNYKLIRSDNNNRIRVELPEGFSGTIHVSYKEPLYFRICEVISLLAFIGLLLHRGISETGKQLLAGCQQPKRIKNIPAEQENHNG